MDVTIYYVYQKADGLFMGSGTPYYDDELYGSTTIPCPAYDSENELVYFINDEWEVRPKPPIVPPEEPIEPELPEEGQQ